MNILITGSSRGIGLGLTNLALEKGHTVIAVTRNPASFKSLDPAHAKNLIVLDADISSPIEHAAVLLRVKELGALDILINNAGMMKLGETYEDLTDCFQLNAIIPFLLTKTLVPLLRKSNSPKVIQISTKMASLDDNTSGGYYAYRSSKTALNMLTRSLALEYPDIAFCLMHPGWVKTEMGGPNAPTNVPESSRGIWNVIDNLTKNSPRLFVDFNGKPIAW